MIALFIVLTILGAFLYICAGLVCGRICATIIRSKNPEMNEVLWFWFGFLCNWIAVLCTFVVKSVK